MKEIEITWASIHGEGMQLELSCEIAGRKHIFASFVANEADEALSLELAVDGQLVRIPVSQLESLIADAKQGVHSESWCDKSPVGGNDA